MEECVYCTEKDSKIKTHKEEVEKEKVRECLKALEKEKMAKGMMCTKADEIRLRMLQQAQMEEKRYIEMEEEERERMWHQVLIEDVRRKEQYERDQERRRQQEMLERRLAYDEQIASANRKRRETLREEREKENRRLERMRKKMEQDHYEALKRKKDQQMTNKFNFIEGHETKLLRLKNEKLRERQMDNNTIRIALNEIDRENQRKRDVMHRLQMDKQDCIENFIRDREIARALEEDRDNVVDQWMREKDKRTEQQLRRAEEEKRALKEKIAGEYRSHVVKMNSIMEQERQERGRKMQEVKRLAVNELQKRLDSANEELRKQLEYRHSLSLQIRNNQKAKVMELMNEETQQRPFTKKAHMFKDAMQIVGKDPERQSTNPVHPFKRKMDLEKSKKQLPSLVL
ncbi:uncharacterized protein [Choristoneura fumiferana]|uniref:uncharacterized protein n=1 Tax=Choristoneura fumiferana TaxID=7141 RepID=UPI003D15B4F5